MTTMTTTTTSADSGFLRSLLWASLTITGATMVLAMLWSNAA
jgi:hypothetical protein